MLTLLDNCFPEKIVSGEWKEKFQKMIPSHGQSLAKNPELHAEIRNWTHGVLGLKPAEEEVRLAANQKFSSPSVIKGQRILTVPPTNPITA